MTVRNRLAVLLAALAVVAAAGPANAADLRIAIVQAQAGDARKYQPLLEYLGAQGVSASFVTAPDYRTAADLFAAGKVDAMFGGSGIAGTMMVKGLAAPLVRTDAVDGANTYYAVVVAPKGSPRFTGEASYFDGKKVIFSALASAGEFYVHSLGKMRPAALMKAASHGAALDALARGQADVAVVKNHVWDREKAKYADLAQVGSDTGANPDGSLIVSTKLPAATSARLSAVLLGLGKDGSPTAAAARDALKIKGYLPAVEQDFAHTIAMLRRAGVTPGFAFAF